MLRWPWLVASSLLHASACSSASDDTAPAGESSSGGAAAVESSESAADSSEAATDSEGSSSGGAIASASTDEGSSESMDSGSSGADCPLGTQDCPCRSDACEGDELQCVDGLCTLPTACDADVDAEPNDDEATAIDLGEVACGDAVAAAQGNIAGGEIDWWTYRGVAQGECDDGMVIVTADAELEVCAYFDCDMGGENVNCVGSRSTVSDQGHPGCCGDGYVTSATSCVGMSSDGVVLISVGGPAEPVCVEYELAYLFG